MEERTYEIPQKEGDNLRIGRWVEIFEAYADNRGDLVKVKTMRVGDKKLVFVLDKHGPRTLRPHEGRITQIEREPERTRFHIHM